MMLALENFAAWVFQTYADRRDKLAIVDDTAALTYGQLQAHVELFAGYLRVMGYRPQQRIIISMDDSVAWPVAFFGCLYAGMNPVLVSNIMPVTDIERIIDISDAAVIISDHCEQWSIPCINRNTVLNPDSEPVTDFYRFHPDEMCLWLLSSGSTGEPKCIVNRHANLYRLMKLVAPGTDIDSRSHVYSTAKMSWTYGCNVSVTFALGRGATAYVTAGVPAPSRIYKVLEQYPITHLWTVPGVLAGLLRHSRPDTVLPAKIFSSGEPLPPQIAQVFVDQHNRQVCEVFGMSETTQIHTIQNDTNWQLGTIGQPLPGVEIQLRDSQGNQVEPGQVGELFVSSPCQAIMYWKDQAKSQATFQGAWVRTGDQCRVNEQGNLVFVGRTDDLVKIKGLYVAPVEIENAIVNLPGIEDCTVVHAPNSQGLAELHAFVVSSPGLGRPNIPEALQKQLPDHKIPRHIQFVDNLPRTLTNKKIRSALRKSLA
jgi:benzoate-CoA ligase